MILVNPQWQGGADQVTCKSAEYIVQHYLGGREYSLVPVDISEESTAMEHKIIGYSAIKRQTEDAYSILKHRGGNKIFSIGGGCDADVASILYLNEIYHGNLAILWFDAHGDINSPNESDTHLFYGMPVRAILGECNNFPFKAAHWVKQDQIINIGGRDLDSSEIEYMHSAGIQRIDVNERNLFEAIRKAIEKTKKTHIYIHFDLDVLDPSEFPGTPVPVPNGIQLEEAVSCLMRIKEEYSVIGFGLYEYLPEKDNNKSVRRFVDYGLELLDLQKDILVPEYREEC